MQSNEFKWPSSHLEGKSVQPWDLQKKPDKPTYIFSDAVIYFT